MSLYGIQKFIFCLKQDGALEESFRRGDESVFDRFPLDSTERAALLKGDIVALFRMGVHPLLLAPFSRYANISAAEYRERLSTERNVRKLRS